jgi:O-antigen/teichoic acid export membrane protein
MDRAAHIEKNLKFAMAGELLLAVLKFLSRRVFVLLLGREYLGLNGLFTDVLSMLSLAELGFSASITYSLYRPVAQGDTETIKSLVRLYRRVYRTVGMVVLAMGLSLTPFLSFFVKKMPEDIPYIPLIYVLNLANASISYFFAYKPTLLFVHQKKYVETAIRAAVSLGATVAQIGVLLLTRNYLYYLFLAIGATIVQNTAVSIQADRLYPYLREKNVLPLPPEILGEIRRNVRAILLHRIGAVAVFNTDNLLISKFVGVATAGLYSNYVMIRSFLNIMVGALFDVITPALGNLAATETMEGKQAAFRRLAFFSAWLFGWMSICLFCLYDPFIDLWLGEGYLLPTPAVLLIVVNFYVTSMRTPVINTKSVLGLFWDDRYKSIVEAAFNLVVSVLLVRRWGVEGIMAGTLISTLAFPFWCEPLVLYSRGLHMPVGEYFKEYCVRLVVTVSAGALTWLLCGRTRSGFVGFLEKGFLCAAVPNLVFLAAYWRMEEFLFLKGVVGQRIRRRR